jgi:Mn2+/Fe2+ NRAMP family transporter
METLTHILASFDIFQVIIGAFPRIFIPIIHAFHNMFIMFSDIASKQFESHPGIISGTVIFLFVYVIWSGLSKLRHSMVSARKVFPKDSN